MRDYEYMRLTMERARDEEAGKLLQNNTRLFRREIVVEGKELEAFVVRYHKTDIVKILPDGRTILANGGWNTSTTLNRIRTYGSSHIHTESGNWFVELAPDPEDERPAHVRRKIPKPYDEPTNPGPEPIKTNDGAIVYDGQHITFPKVGKCVAGTIEEYSYQELVYSWHVTDADRRTGRPVHGYGFEKGDLVVWRNGVIKWDEYQTWQGDDKQCPHCREFSRLRQRWYEMENGTYGRNRDRGHAKWREMMERFGTVEAWQDAYKEDFRARRAYLKAEREWIARNRVPFFDGIIVDENGYAHRPSKSFTKRLAAHERKVERIKKRIDKFCDLAVENLKAGMSMPGGGDCWYCSMITTDEHTGRNVSMGDAMQTLHPNGSLTVEPSHGHLNDHMREGYVVPSLLVNAMRERGYKDVGIYIMLDMNQDTQTMGRPDGHYDNLKRDLRSYMRKRLIPQTPSK